MSSVDNRIVNMTFNNKDFERNAAQSTKTLDNLERTIANTGQGKGLSSFGDGVQTVSAKFSALQVIGVTALATIASKAVSAGLDIVKSLTIAPLVQGFQEYQTNLNSIQTVMSNTGEDVDTVNQYMKKLNHYSDRTIYNFSEMAKNIGTFTAAGVDLETATSSIKGIANLAALSGSSSQQASTAMYQLSQAISAGRVGLQDWNSVVNAGMGGKIFQTALSRTAEHFGKLEEGAAVLSKTTGQLTVNGESFRQSIMATGGNVSWLDGVTLTETLKQISGDYSVAELRAKHYTEEQIKDIKKLANTAFNAATKIKTAPQLLQVIQESIGSIFANSFSLILGNFKQSKKLWTSIGAQIVGPFGILTQIGNGVSKTLRSWVKLGGRNKMLDGFERAFKNIWRLIVPLKNAFRDIFPPDGVSGASRLVAFSQAFKDFAEFLKPSVKTMHQLRDIFGGVFAVLHIGWTVVKSIAGAFGALFKAIFKNAGSGRDGILGIAAAFGKTLIALDKFLTQGGKMEDIIKSIGSVAGSVLGPLIKILGTVGSTIADSFNNLSLDNVAGSIIDIKALFLDLAQNAVVGLRKIFAPIDALDGFFDGLYVKIRNLRSMFYIKNEDFFGGSSGITKATATISDGMDKIGGVTDTAKTKITDGLGKVGDAADTVSGKLSDGMDKISGATDKAKDAVKGMYDVVGGNSGDAATATTDTLSEAADNAQSGLEKVKSILAGIGSGIANAFGALGGMFSWVKKQFSDLFGNFDGMDWVAFFNAIFSGLLIRQITKTTKAIDDIRTWRKIFDDTFGQLTKTMKTMQNSLRAKMILDIALSVGVLSASMIALSLLDTKQLAKGIGGLGSVMAIMVGSLKAMSSITAGEVNAVSLAGSLTLISFAMINLAVAVGAFGHMDIKTLAKGIGAMAIALSIMVGAVVAMAGISGALKSAAFGIVLMSGAMVILAGAVLAFGKMNMKTLAKGLGAMAIALQLLVGAMMLLGAEGLVIEGSAGAILIVSGAMVILAAAVSRFGKMDIKTLAKGLGAMAIALGLVVVALIALSVAGPEVALSGLGILLLAVALEKIALVVIALGLAPWKVVAVGIGFVALALGVLLAAGAVAMVVAPGLIALGVAVTLLGAGMLLAGVGMTLFAAGFAVFSAAGVAGTALIIAAFHAFLAILPELAIQLAASIVAFLKALANAAPKIRKSVGEIVRNMLGTFKDAIKPTGAVFSALVDEGIRILDDSVPKFIVLGFDILMAFLQGLDEHIEEIADRAASLSEKFMRELGKQTKPLAEAGADMLIDTMNGLADAIREKDDLIGEAALNLAEAFVEGFTTSLRLLLSHVDWKGILKAAIPGGGIFDQVSSLINPRISGVADKSNPWETLAATIKSSAKTIRSVMDEVIKYIISRDYPQEIVDAALGVQAGQLLADKMAARSETLEKSAAFAEKKADKAKEKRDKLREIADNKKATAKQKKAAKDAEAAFQKAKREAQKKRARADIQPSKAEFAQMRVDKKGADLQTTKDVFDAVKSGDFEEAGNLKADQAADLAQRAKDMLAKSQADQKLAEKLEKGNKKERELAAKMREQAQREAEAAAKWAGEARQAMTDATNFYKQAAQARMDDIIAQHKAAVDDLAAQKQAAIDQAAYDKADNAGKAKIMADRAAASQAKADAQEQIYRDQLALADQAIAAGDFDAANAYLDKAEAAAAAAAQAASDAADQAAQAQQLADQAAQDAAQATASGGTGAANNIQAPSRTALEDAAKSVDRYTQSLVDASVAAGSSQAGIHLTQVNTSPVALSASEIYRQTNNLLSLAQARKP